ncbi:pyrophosphate-energized vacuolar membrane proton pump-like [Pyrus ussuriensis x Pyrus communis]|uniref:Pyrophosphate-energized vacuolar membrane proton pump-like n=1 Tax=Pyrus ussuriensis x Pyrus communis TaxID=2448454 RepID=A0A5N5GBD9_9ROSA|nr:pyrophosphate-energized vacuolar membrane proton pump-like [Pyrus ussuriensis x Pyrus communis]
MGFDLALVVEGLSCIQGSESEAVGMEVGVAFGELENGRREFWERRGEARMRGGGNWKRMRKVVVVE